MDSTDAYDISVQQAILVQMYLNGRLAELRKLLSEEQMRYIAILATADGLRDARSRTRELVETGNKGITEHLFESLAIIYVAYRVYSRKRRKALIRQVLAHIMEVHAQTIDDGLKRALDHRLRVLLNLIATGPTKKDIARHYRRALRQLEAVYTTAGHAAQTYGAREAYGAEYEVYKAVLDERTTEFCRSHDGRLYRVGRGPVPPMHYY